MNIRLTRDELADLCICALRYCQGRRTYMPSAVIAICKRFLPEFLKRDLRVMANDCEEQRRTGKYGDDMDKEDWIRWREALLEEIARRD